MEFGTSKITVLIGSRGLNNSISVDGIGVCDYDGYADGDWIAPEKLSDAVVRVLDGAKSSARRGVDRLYVGVPGEFMRCFVTESSISLGKKRRVLESDVEMLHEQGCAGIEHDGYERVNIGPVYYTLEQDSKLINPVGLVSNKLSGCISYMYMDTAFKTAIESAVRFAGVEVTDYVSTAFAETQLLFDDYRRDAGTLLADVGALETTLSYGRGDGICFCTTLPWGGDYITYVLTEALGLSRDTADKLKKQVNLCLDPQYVMDSDEPGFMQTEYTVDENGEPRSFRVSDINNLVEQAIKYFVQCVEQALKSCEFQIPDMIPLSITGGGLNIRGSAECVKLRLKRDVETVAPKLPTWDNPVYSAALSLMDVVLASEGEREGLASKLKSFFTKRK